MHFLRDLPIEYLEVCPTIDEKYKVLFKLGSGRYSKVKMGLSLATNTRVAIKIMNHRIDETDIQRGYQEQTLSMFLNEVSVCLEAKHKNIVQIIDFNVGGVYRTSDGKVYRILYYVMKIAENGELFRLINQSEIFSEKTSRYIFRQLIAGIKNLHQKGLAHCDIKTENILLDSKLNVKIADFGFAREFINAEQNKINFSSLENTVGSTKCNAPEITNDPKESSFHADEIDIFACGCLLFELVMKAPPFKTSDLKDEYYKKLASNDHSQFWEIFASKCKPSADFKDLIEKLLNPDPKSRITLEEIFKHPWVAAETISKQEYKKELSARLKKVLLKVRKEQESEIKKFFSKERSKHEFSKIEQFQLNISKRFEDKIREIKHVLSINDPGHSDSNSSFDPKEIREDEFCPICPEKTLHSEPCSKGPSQQFSREEVEERNERSSGNSHQ